MKKYFYFLLSVLFAVSAFLMPASAKEAYNSYGYNVSGEVVASQKGAIPLYKIDSSSLGTEFSSPSDIFFSADNRLFILDKSVGCIIICDSNGRLIKKITGVSFAGKISPFSKPGGIFAANDGTVYVADTENSRIVQMDENGIGIRELKEPASPLFGSDFEYKPVKVALDSVGQIYVLSENYNNGIIVLDGEGEFLKCIGAPAVTFNLAEYFWKSISTDAQKARMKAYVPTEFNNICLDENDFIYATCNAYSTWDYLGKRAVSLKKLNAKGENILKKDSRGDYPYGDKKVTGNGVYPGGSSIVDAADLNYGMFAILDRNRCRVFVYNPDSELLFSFGSPGLVDGTLSRPTALAYGQNRFYVADDTKKCIQVFGLTDYGNTLVNAYMLNAKGDYEGEQQAWKKIYAENSNSKLAILGIAHSIFNSGDYKSAMSYFKELNDTENYSKAYRLYRQEYVNNHNWLIWVLLICALLIILGIKFWLAYRKKHPKNHGVFYNQVMFSRKIIFRPLSGMWGLTWEKGGSMSAGLVLLAAASGCMLLQTYGVGYLFGGKDAQKTLILIPLLKLAAGVGLFSLCNWCVSSLMDGKGKLKNIFTVNCYALTPIIILIPVSVILSRFMTLDEGNMYSMIVGLTYFWVALLIICGNKQVHDYDMGKSLLVLLITIAVLVIVLFLFVLFLILMQQVFTFAVDFAKDIAGHIV